MRKNMIGLEAEFFLKNEAGELVFPAYYGFGHDDFPLLGEIRGEPSDSKEGAAANLLKEWWKMCEMAEKKKLTVVIEAGFLLVKPTVYANALREAGMKTVAKCKNIYGTDLLGLSDSLVTDGVLTGHHVSCGLHVHFSSSEEQSTKYTIGNYLPVVLPLSVGGAQTELKLFRLAGEDEKEVKAYVSRITNPVIKHIVKDMDNNVLPGYVGDLPKLKYRNPGFYELKPWGFEYRSLPFNNEVFEDIYDIASHAMDVLNAI